MNDRLPLGAGDRVLFVAPHPDDDALAGGGLLQRALAAGAQVRILFATDGENNPWTQRLVERRLRIGPAERERFGRRRRGEALAALQRLGLEARDAQFLGYPDQGITALLLTGGEAAVERLAAPIASWRPTLLVLPSAFDLHPDHSALAVLGRLALTRMDPGYMPARVLSYLVHTRGPVSSGRHVLRFDLGAREWARKREAIACHATQVAVHRRTFLSPARGVETFRVEGPASDPEAHPVRLAGIEEGSLRLEVAPRSRPGAFGRAAFLLVADGRHGRQETLAIDLAWRRGAAAIRRLGSGGHAGEARLIGGRRGGLVTLPVAALPAAERLFVKIERPFGFFDEAGWLEIPAPARAALRPEGALPRAHESFPAGLAPSRPT
ncbi:MAG TPA: PIG-L family deacetylase [Candidatus Polarisedimenticolia bacterium]|nr:PIG-L family deacetylase [Candidatus Polarisedimenticolia bacterium]